MLFISTFVNHLFSYWISLLFVLCVYIFSIDEFGELSHPDHIVNDDPLKFVKWIFTVLSNNCMCVAETDNAIVQCCQLHADIGVS